MCQSCFTAFRAKARVDMQFLLYCARKPADVAVTLHGLYINKTRSVRRGCYRENAIAIESEARDPLNVQSKADMRAFAPKECNLHCDVNKRSLPPFGSLDSFWIMRSQRSRRRNQKLWALFKQHYSTHTNTHCLMK